MPLEPPSDSDDDLRFLATLMALTMPEPPEVAALRQRVEERQAEFGRGWADVMKLLLDCETDSGDS